MSDIVKRLRYLGDHAAFEPSAYHTAADEIERLRAENERLRHALLLCRTELFTAAYYRGYEGGPLDHPSVDLALQLSGDILNGASDE